MMKKLFFSALLFSFSVAAVTQVKWSVDLDAGFAFQGYNEVRIPSSTGTDFDLNRDFDIEGPVIPFRVRVGLNFSERNHLFLLYAPLTVNYAGIPPYDIIYQGTLFPEEEFIDALYKFNSYRITYRRDLVLRDNWTFGLGFTAKIRDARIKLSTENLTDKKDDLGFVPLLNIFAKYDFPQWSVFLQGDGLAGGPGRAFDINVGAKIPVTDLTSFKAGYRLLEGGADVEEVYNFTIINVIVAGLFLEF